MLCAPVLQGDDQGLLPSKAENILKIEKKIKTGSTYLKNSSINIFGKANLSILIDINNSVQTLKLLFS